MFLNYFKTALRGFLKHKGFALINLAGLAVGIAGSLAVFLWVVDEVSYDSFHTNADDIYRCYREVTWNNETKSTVSTSAPIGPTLANRAPDVLEYVRMARTRMTLRFENTGVEKSGKCVDPSFLTTFSFPLIEGDARTALSGPNSIVLTQTTADRLFGDEDPIGKALSNGLMVTGVAEDPPHNSSIEFDFLVPFAYGEQAEIVYPEDLWTFNLQTYFLLSQEADIAALDEQMLDLFPEAEHPEAMKLHLQPLSDTYLKNPNGGGRITNVYVFSLVAILILVVACINFMNLSTARAETRMTEIALKKIIGAGRGQIAMQILTESLIQTVIAVILAVCLLEAALPYLGEVVGKQLVLEPSLGLILVLAAVALVTALAAGSYPALVLSSFKPATVLKGKNSTGGRGYVSLIRRMLVVFQFTVSTALIAGAFIIHGQLNLIEKKDLGIQRNDIVVLRLGDSESDAVTMKKELLKYPGILGVTAVFEPPTRCGWLSNGYDFEGKVEDEDVQAGGVFADYDYVDVFGLQILEGRNFSREFATDETEAFLVNETAARAMGMDAPIGKTVGFAGQEGRIIGVVKDFHFNSLHEAIGPLIIDLDLSSSEYLCINVAGEDVSGSLGFIERQWNEFRPGEEFSYQFFDDMLGRGYRADVRTGSIVLGFTTLAVLVACLGLLGLAAFGAGQRRREIGIRKVHGASLGQLVSLISREYFALVVISSVIGGPIAYYVMGRWLQSFAYRIDVGWHYFLLSGALVLIIATATVSYQAIRAASADPIKTLRSE